MIGLNDPKPTAFEGFGPWLAGSGEARSLKGGSNHKIDPVQARVGQKGHQPYGAARKPHLEEGDRSHGTFHAVATFRDTKSSRRDCAVVGRRPTVNCSSWPACPRVMPVVGAAAECFISGFLYPQSRSCRQAKSTPRSACRGCATSWVGPGESSQSAATMWSP